MSPEAGTATPPPPKGVVPPSEPGGRSGFLSDVIVELGFATPDAVEEAVREARSGSTVAQVLVENGAISEEQLARATAGAYGLAYIDLDSFDVDREAAALIRPSAAKRYRAVPVGFVGGGLLGGDDRPGGLARGERHRRDDEARRAAGGHHALRPRRLLAELAAAAEERTTAGGPGRGERAPRRCSGRRATAAATSQAPAGGQRAGAPR